MLSFTSAGSRFSNMILFCLKQFLLTLITLTFWLLNFNHTVLPTHPISLRPPQTPSAATANLGDSRHTIVLPLPFSPSCQGYWRGKAVKTPSDTYQNIQTLMVFFAGNYHFWKPASLAVAFQQTFGRSLNASSMYFCTNRWITPKTL